MQPGRPAGGFVEGAAVSPWRRSIYLTSRRTYPMTFLGVFDYPIIDTNCTRRVPSATPLQSLTLMNDPFMWEAAGELAANASRLAGDGAPVAGKIRAAYLLTAVARAGRGGDPDG